MSFAKKSWLANENSEPVESVGRLSSVKRSDVIDLDLEPDQAPGRQTRWSFWQSWVLRVSSVGVMAAAGLALAFVHWRTPVVVRTHVVERGEVRELVSSVTAGRVTPEREVTLRAELSGSVQELRHRRGEVVREGEPLVLYDPRELRERRRVVRYGVALAKAKAAEAKATFLLSRRASERAERLHDSGSAPAVELDQARARAEATENAAKAAHAALEQAVAEVELATTALSKATVRAPFSGVVLETSVDQGDIVSPGLALSRLADTSHWYVEADIDEADLERIAPGMPVEATLDAFPNRRIVGTLTEIAPSVNRDARGSRSVLIRVMLVPDARLRVGMSADIDIVASRRENALWIPSNAATGRGAERVVYVLKDGHARRRSITVGISNWEQVEVLSGLSVGDLVIESPSSSELAEGTRVQAELPSAVHASMGER